MTDDEGGEAMTTAPEMQKWPACPACGEDAWSVGNDWQKGWSIGHANQTLSDCRVSPEVAEAFAADWAKRDKGEVTAEELGLALQAAKTFPGHEMDWPYIDEFVIDGSLQPLVEWLCQHYRITPR